MIFPFVLLGAGLGLTYILLEDPLHYWLGFLFVTIISGFALRRVGNRRVEERYLRGKGEVSRASET